MTQQQILLNKHYSQKTDVSSSVGGGIQNSPPSTVHEINTMDFMGLSWILTDDDDVFSKEFIMGEK